MCTTSVRVGESGQMGKSKCDANNYIYFELLHNTYEGILLDLE